MSVKICIDHNRHTCIEVSRDASFVKFIPMTSEGLVISELPLKTFDLQFSELPKYEVSRAAKLYAEYGAQVGASHEAMQVLASLTTLTEKEITMATAKKKAESKKAEGKTAVPKKSAAPSKAAAKKTDGKPSAAERFRELIVEGKLSDDDIFAKVQKEYGLEDNKRRYVSFYRFDCKRKGLIK